MVGGLLVAAAVTLSWAAGGSGPAPGTPCVIAARSLAPGHVVRPSDVAIVRADVPAQAESGLVRAVDEVVGHRLLGPMGRGDLVTRAAIGPEGASPAYQVSFPVTPAWSVDGTLLVGERVDVLATVGQGADATTSRVLRSALIVALSDDDGGGLGGEASQTITVEVDRLSAVLDATTAARAGVLTVVRTPRTGS